MRLKRPRKFNEDHLAFIRQLFCVVCGDNTSVEAAHLRSGNLYYGKQSTGMQTKPDDCWSLPVCSRHHREQHTRNELEWWANEGINPFELALSLYAASGDAEMATAIIQNQCSRS